MKKNEELKLTLRKVLYLFEKEEYENSLSALEKSGKIIIKALNKYNNKH